MASTLGDLAKVCAKLEQIYREDVVGNPKRGGWEAGAIETIRKLAEVVVHGEAESEVCFELFTEKCMMGLLVSFATGSSARVAVQIQVIQTVSILLQNVTRQTSLYLLLSSNHINALLDFIWPDASDATLGHAHLQALEELEAHFVSLLKTLSLRLDATTVQFFVGDGAAKFPLFDAALRYFSRAEAMTRTAALAALLNIYRVDDALVRRYAAAKSGALVDSLAALLQNAFDAAINGLEAASGAARGPGAAVVETQLALLQDLLYYAQDVLDMRVAGADALWCESLSAFLERVLSRVDGGDSACAWFVVSLFFRALQHAPLLRRCCRLVHGQRPTLLAALASVDEAVSVCAVLALDALDFGATLDEAAFERSKARSLVESLTLDPPAPESRGADARAGRRSLFDDEFTKQGRSNSSGPGRSNSSSTLFDDESSLFEDERSDAADTPDGQRGRDAPPTPGARVSGEAPPPGAVRSPTSDEAEAFRGDAAARLAESLSAEGRSAGATALVAHALGHMLDAPGPHVSKCAAGVRRAVSAAAKRVLALSAAGDARDAFDDEWRARRGSAASRRALAARLSQRAFVVLRRCDRPRGVPAEFADGPPTLRGEVQALLAVRGLLAQIGGGPSAFVHGDASDELLRPLAPRGDAETMQLAGRTCVACAAVARPEPLEPRRAGAAAGLPAPPSRRLDVYLVLDNEHLLLAVPDALRLASGRVLSRAPLHAVSAAVDANDAAALDVTVTSAAAVGLMRRELPPEAPQRARPRADAGASRWTLKLIFESEKTCRIARNLLDDRRRVERAKGYDDLRGHLEQLARLDDATQSPENAASTLRN